MAIPEHASAAHRDDLETAVEAIDLEPELEEMVTRAIEGSAGDEIGPVE